MNEYTNHVKEVCEIVDKELKDSSFLNDRYNLLSQTVRYKIMADLCTKVLVDNYEGVLDNKQVEKMLDTFIDNVTRILDIKIKSKSSSEIMN